jgi:amino acid permease
MNSMPSAARKTFVRVLFVLAITSLALLLAAILLPPKDGHARTRDRGGEAPSVSQP